MKAYLIALLLLAKASLTPASAAVVTDLGIDPTSAAGSFNRAVGGGLFDDQYTFQLVGTQFLTIASVTNVFPAATDFIQNFSGSVFLQVGAIGGGDDIRVIGPRDATLGCGPISNCQGFAGSAILPAGNYYLDVSGTGGGTSGYGGNLAASALIGIPPVPEPATWAMMLLGLFSIGLLKKTLRLV